MQHVESTKYLATQASKALRPTRCFRRTDGDDGDGDVWDVEFATRTQDLPYVDLRWNADRKAWSASGGGHEGHDNASRLDGVLHFLNHHVLPYGIGGSSAFLAGRYALQLHDSYTYLDSCVASADGGDSQYAGVLVFSKSRDHRGPVLLPDMYQLDNYGGITNIRDDVPWESKRDCAFFAGCTTGSRDPLKNARISACVWSLSDARRSQLFDFRISNIVQMDRTHALAAVPLLAQAVARGPAPVYEYKHFKYCVDFPGNTCSWMRVPQILYSNSLLMQQRHKDMCWYYPLMMENVHYVGFDAPQTDLEQRVAARAADEAGNRRIVANANIFARSFLTRATAAVYTLTLLESVASNHAP